MFKGFSKRNASEAALEDDIFSPRPMHGPGAEKENQPTKAATMGGEMLTKERKPIPAKLAPTIASKTQGRDDMLLARRDRMLETVATNKAFERMLDDLQIPPTLRPKLATLESPVKAAMIRSSQFLTLTSSSPATTSLRRTRSTNSLDLDSQGNSIPPASEEPSSPFVDLAVSHSRTVSVDVGSFFAPASPVKPLRLGKDKAKSGAKEKGKPTTPEQFAVMLSKVSATAMDVELVKKLRLYLRNEAAGWTEAFLAHGGYAALDARLMDLLNVEWREEQHDDQCLHEILRCFKALSTSEGGCQALRDHYPHPFIPLTALLYSDKKPGDLSTRQLIVELLQILFELYPSARPISPRLRPNEIPVAAPILPAGNLSLFTVLREILLTERPDPAEQPHTPLKPHDFIEHLHVPRIYKTYLQELSDVCRDYFWIFCHPNNTVWLLKEVDEDKVERPKAPGGMTGGVEYEAMVYLTSHFKLVNAIAAAALEQQLPVDHPHSAFKFHHDLQLSGMERIIATARKASTTYYGTLHLEIARYVSLAARAKFTFSPGFVSLVGAPPTGMQRTTSSGPGPTSGKLYSTPSTPSRLRTVPGAPRLPTPQKGEAIVL